VIPTRQRLEAKRVPEAEIARVRMPVGADIGARSPAEISVAIAAELIAWRATSTSTSTSTTSAIGADPPGDPARSSSGAMEARSAPEPHETES